MDSVQGVLINHLRMSQLLICRSRAPVEVVPTKALISTRNFIQMYSLLHVSVRQVKGSY